MAKLFISCVLIVLLFAAPVVTVVAPNTEDLKSERRKRASFPDIPTKITSGNVQRFFLGVDGYFADHFPLRASLLGLAMRIIEAGDGNLNMDKCYRGKGNWLFLGNNYANCVEVLKGKILLPTSALQQKAEAYLNMAKTVEACGAKFFVFLGPNKSSIYPEYLPPMVTPAPQRLTSQLVDALREAGVSVYDPTECLIKAKNTGLLYYRTDTHWNAQGAHEAFEGFRKWAGFPLLPPLSFEEGSVYDGDLINIGGYEQFPLSTGDNFTLRWSTPPSLHEKDGLITNQHAVMEKTIWVFGDSFSDALRPFITATFKKVRFFTLGEFDAVMSSRSPKPDTILWVIVERNFVYP